MLANFIITQSTNVFIMVIIVIIMCTQQCN